MNPPRRKLTLRALVVIVALFASDFGGMIWIAEQRGPGPRVGHMILRKNVWVPINPLADLAFPFVFLAPIVLLITLIYLYVPPKIDIMAILILILVVLVLLIVPALKHS